MKTGRVLYVKKDIYGFSCTRSNIVPTPAEIAEFLGILPGKQYYDTGTVRGSNQAIIEFLGPSQDLGIYHTDDNSGNRGEKRSENILVSDFAYGSDWRYGIRGNAVVVVRG